MNTRSECEEEGGEEMTEKEVAPAHCLSRRSLTSYLPLLSVEPRLLAMLRASGPLFPTTRPSLIFIAAHKALNLL